MDLARASIAVPNCLTRYSSLKYANHFSSAVIARTVLTTTTKGQRWLCKMILVYTNLPVWASSLSSQAGLIREEKGLRVGPDNVQCMSRAGGREDTDRRVL